MLREIKDIESKKDTLPEDAPKKTLYGGAVSGKQIEPLNITRRKVCDGSEEPGIHESRMEHTGQLRMTGQQKTERQEAREHKAERPVRRRTIDRRVHGTGETGRLWPEEGMWQPKKEETVRYSARLRSQRSIKRRRQVRRNNYMLLAAFGMICLVMIVGLHSLGKSKKAEAASSSDSQQAEQKAEDLEIAEPVTETLEEQVAEVKKEAKEKGFPDSIIELLDKNPETLQFVEDFEFKDTFQTSDSVGDSLVKGEIPQLLQWDERWGYAPYGTGYVATCGCGPTCLSMVISGMTGDASATPAAVAEYSDKNGYIDENNNTYWELMTAAPEHWGLSVKGGKTAEDAVASEISNGHAIICSVGPGDFTQNGHFIVLAGYEDGKVKVYDPFNQENSEKLWKYKKIKGQIKSLWVYSN